MIYNNIKDLKQDLQSESRFLALDVGTKVIGLSISDQSRTICNPFGTIDRHGNKKDFPKIQQYIIEHQIELLVIGLPIHIDDTDSKMSLFVKRFALNLNEYLSDIKIILYDERYSSSSARIFIDDNLKLKKKDSRKKIIDKIAANIILETFLLDFNKN